VLTPPLRIAPSTASPGKLFEATVTLTSARVTARAADRLWRKWDTAASTWTRLSAGGAFLVARGLGGVRATVG
jgi:hypothetical protein